MRPATEDDIPWFVEYAKEMHGVLRLGDYDPEHCAEVARSCRCFVDGEGMLGGREVPVLCGSEPALNHVFFWNSKGGAWRLLDAHEAASPLPSSLTVPCEHPRYKALTRALRGRGYEGHELVMVKR